MEEGSHPRSRRQNSNLESFELSLSFLVAVVSLIELVLLVRRNDAFELLQSVDRAPTAWEQRFDVAWCHVSNRINTLLERLLENGFLGTSRCSLSTRRGASQHTSHTGES